MKISSILMGSAVLALGTAMFASAPVAPVSATTPAVAVQGRAPMVPADQAKRQADRLKTSLSLSDDVTAKVQAAYVTYYTALAPAADGTRPSADARTAATDKLKTDLKAAGLTDDQVATATKPRAPRGGGR